MTETIFSKIIDGEIPATKVVETESVLAFEDINPQAPIHILVIPKKPLKNIIELASETSNLANEINQVIKQVVQLKNLEPGGFRVVTNCGEDGGQTVNHLHFHILGGRPLSWPPG